MNDSDDFVVGSVWLSPYSMYTWLVLESTRHKTGVSRRWVRSGRCLILGQDETRVLSFPVGSVIEWRSELQWCNSSKRIT